MQRQSLGSPASKLHVHGVKEEDLDGDEKRRELGERDGDKKAEKVHRSSRRGEDSVIHLIPFVVLACFLILVLVSHSPSDEELLKHGGFKRFSDQEGTMRVDSDFERLLEMKKGNVLGVVAVVVVPKGVVVELVNGLRPEVVFTLSACSVGRWDGKRPCMIVHFNHASFWVS
ncbi:hypothetical protein H6P81_005364 [Aristolochia fimbriata]|uniref:Uncharacterized protein n=1 Tax=Aristolochia fimbriata TaxID=158543 RepID=A0AAV7EU75_ARIFI|nr:hypothetical protein H6P81_005364 [Aristolochia fimbriata]